MSKGDVLEYLEKYDEGSPKEIAKALGIRESSISLNMKKLVIDGDIVLARRVKVEIYWHNVWKLSEVYKNS